MRYLRLYGHELLIIDIYTYMKWLCVNIRVLKGDFIEGGTECYVCAKETNDNEGLPDIRQIKMRGDVYSWAGIKIRLTNWQVCVIYL